MENSLSLQSRVVELEKRADKLDEAMIIAIADSKKDREDAKRDRKTWEKTSNTFLEKVDGIEKKLDKYVRDHEDHHVAKEVAARREERSSKTELAILRAKTTGLERAVHVGRRVAVPTIGWASVIYVAVRIAAKVFFHIDL